MPQSIDSQKQQASTLIRGHILVRSTFWNLSGQVAPLIAALVAIPFLIKGLGTDRFGVLTLVWIMIGYFNIFDFGLGRALTKIVSEKLATGKEEQIPTLVWTGLLMMVVVGSLGAVVLSILARPIVTSVLNIPSELQSETVMAIYVLAVGIPFVVARAGLAGILQAQQRFDLVNIIQIPIGIFMFVSPLAILPFSNSLFYVTLVLVVGRVITTLWNLLQCFRTLPVIKETVRLSRSAMRELMSFGGWMTISNIISPLMVRLDRFMIGTLVSVAALAYYATPFEMITKLWLVPVAIVGTLFPAFSMSYVTDKDRTSFLFNRGVKYIFFSLFPVTIIIVTFSYEGIALWLGTEFAQNSTEVLQLLAIGVFVNSLAQVPFGLLQGAGRPDITAKIHLIEFPIYLPLVLLMINMYGIKGAALAWVIRVSVDAFLLFIAVPWMLDIGKVRLTRINAVIASAVVLVFCFAFLSTNLMMKVVFLALFLLCFVLISWFFFISPDEKALAHKLLKFRVASTE